MAFKTVQLNQGTTIHRAAPNIGLQRGNGTATSTKHNFSWFATSRAGAEPYVIIQPHLNNKIMSRIREYEIMQPLLFLNLNNASTIQKLDRNMKDASLGNMKLSFQIGNNGQVKRVSEINQLNRNKKTANRLRTFLLLYHPEISGWHHGKMERPDGGYQSGEVVVFTPTKSVIGKAARGSGVPSPVSNSRQPLSPLSSPRQAQAGSSSSRQARPSPRQAPSPSRSAKPFAIKKRRNRGLFIPED